MISFLAALVLGLMQGVLEWLPISSQGNIILLAVAFLNIKPAEALNLSVYLHLGTGFGALTYFWKDVKKAIKRESEASGNLFNFLVVATITTGIVGFPLFLFAISTSYYGDAILLLVGFSLIVTGLIQRKAEKTGVKEIRDIKKIDGLILGIIQGFSAVPGISRSGVTTSALLLKDFSGEEAFKISFLMSIPASFAAIIGVMLLEGKIVLHPTFLVAVVASYVSAIISIDVLIKLTRRISFWILCIILGFLALHKIFFLY